MAKEFQQPAVKLKDEITHDNRQGCWSVAAAAPEGLEAVCIGESGLRSFLNTPEKDPAALTAALRADLKRFEKLVWSIEMQDKPWANDFDIDPVFKPGSGDKA